MLKDSSQLATLKDKIARGVAVQAPDRKTAQTDQQDAAAAGGSTPTIAPKVPAKEAKRPGKSARIKKEAPEKPAADLQDVRRSTREI
jgi:hypothetical protein